METSTQPSENNETHISPADTAAQQSKKRPRREQTRAKLKLGEGVAYEDLVRQWTQCCFLIPRKQKLCNMSRSPGSLYCGNHAPATDEDERVPCPLDGSHTVSRRNLAAHVKKCNAKKYEDELAALPYYCLNCNGGPVTVTGAVERETEAVTERDTHTHTDEDELAVDLEALVSKVHAVFEKVEISSLEALPADARIDAVDARIRETVGRTQTSFKQTRHTEQDIAIVHQLVRNQLLSLEHFDSPATPEDVSAPSKVFLEFGAGKGLLGLAVHVSDPRAFLVFIERSSNRKKVDKLLNERGVANFQRVRMDIRHCLVPALPCLQHTPQPTTEKHTRSATVVAKHLCGLASDLAIRSLSHLRGADVKRGLGIATCCHHACRFEDYVGGAWLAAQSITRAEFNVLKQWSGWASLSRTADYRKPKQQQQQENDDATAGENESEEAEHAVPAVSERLRPKAITAEEMLAIGKKVKRIFDYGRVQYMKNELGMSAQLVYYCDSKLSPECVMIVAKDE